MSHKLTQRIFSRIQNSTRDYFDSTNHKSQTEADYFKMIAEKQIVACYKCRIEIKIGEEYETTHKYGRGDKPQVLSHSILSVTLSLIHFS
jgi:hypothetical protein